MNPHAMDHVSNGKMTVHGDIEKNRVWGFFQRIQQGKSRWSLYSMNTYGRNQCCRESQSIQQCQKKNIIFFEWERPNLMEVFAFPTNTAM